MFFHNKSSSILFVLNYLTLLLYTKCSKNKPPKLKKVKKILQHLMLHTNTKQKWALRPTIVLRTLLLITLTLLLNFSCYSVELFVSYLIAPLLCLLLCYNTIIRILSSFVNHKVTLFIIIHNLTSSIPH